MNHPEFKNFTFFGSSRFSVIVLDELKKQHFSPSLIISNPPRPKNRGMELTSTEVSKWAKVNNIPLLEPEKLDSAFFEILKATSHKLQANQIFLVASYGKIIPQAILDIPVKGSLNIHPSLLPKYRGASPIQSQIVADEKKVGVTIMKMTAKMDAGPIIAAEETELEKPHDAISLEEKLAVRGAKVFAKVIPAYLSGMIEPIPQDESQVIYTKKIKKEDALIDLTDDPSLNMRKILAFKEWPVAYYFADYQGKKIRVKILEADLNNNGKLLIERVIPENDKEMSFEDFAKKYGTYQK